jgi:SAM-dependent methyltransferase
VTPMQHMRMRPQQVAVDAGEPRAEELGAAIRREVDRLLPADWVWEGTQVLDFGCRAGRVLRHFSDLVPHATFWGCDSDGGSIAWLNEHLAPMRGLVCAGAPGLPLADGSLDLVWATSVFSDLTDHWSGWLDELERLLAPGAILIAACLGEEQRRALADLPWAAARAGTTVTAHGESFDVGGPQLLCSPWWTSARRRQAFDVLRVEPSGFLGASGSGHGVVVVRRRHGEVRGRS